MNCRPFVIVVLILGVSTCGCRDRGAYQADLAVYGIGFGGGYQFHIYEVRIAAFELSNTSDRLFELQLEREQARKLWTALRAIPFSTLEQRYTTKLIDDGAALELSVRLDAKAAPRLIGMENCRLDEVQHVIRLLHGILSGSEGSTNEAASMVGFFLNEDLPICTAADY